MSNCRRVYTNKLLTLRDVLYEYREKICLISDATRSSRILQFVFDISFGSERGRGCPLNKFPKLIIKLLCCVLQDGETAIYYAKHVPSCENEYVLSSVGSVLHSLASATALDVPVVGRTGKKMDGGNREEMGKDKKAGYMEHAMATEDSRQFQLLLRR